MKQEHHDGGTGTGRNEPITTQGTESTGIATLYHNYMGSLSTDITPDDTKSLAESGKTQY